MNSNKFIAKGLLLTISGLILVFIPKIITYTLYGICIIIALACIFEIIQGLASGDLRVVIPCLIGTAILIGVVILLPKIIAFGLGFIGGLIIAMLGISEIVKSIKSDKGLVRGIIGAVMLIAGGFCVINPFNAGEFARIIIGVVIILVGIFYLYVARVAASRRNGSTSGIIDVSGYTIDNK